MIKQPLSRRPWRCPKTKSPLWCKRYCLAKAFPTYQTGKIMWTVNGVAVEQAVADFMQAGLLPDSDYRPLIDKIRKEMDPDPYNLFLILLEESGAMLDIDLEAGQTPVSHDLLVRELRGISRGIFHPTHIHQTIGSDPKNSDGTIYNVRWIFQNALYWATADDHGDWYDLSSITDAVDFCLKENAIEERFFLLDTGGQNVRILFGAREVLAALSEKYYLPIIFGD